MVKNSTKASHKSKKNKTSSQSVTIESEKPESKTDLHPVEIKDLSEIKISIESYQHITPVYTSSNLSATCHYLGQEVGQSEKIILTDDAVNTASDEFKIYCDVGYPKELDKLVSNPVMIRIYQTPLTDQDTKLVPDEAQPEEPLSQDFMSSIESAISLYEALTGDKVEMIEPLPIKKRKKSKTRLKEDKKKKGQGSKTSKSSKDSESKLSKKSSGESKKTKKSKEAKLSSKDHSKETTTTTPNETLIGSCVLDLLPLIFGKTTFTQFVPIILPQTYCDERMITYKHKPGLVITTSIAKPIEFSCKPVILNFTLESIYNVPSIMNEDMEYQVCVSLPLVDLPREPLLLKNGNFTTKALGPEEHKLWPDLPKDYSNVTLYLLNQNPESVKNHVANVDLNETFKKEKPKIQFNFVKRQLLLKDGFFALYDQAKKYQKIILEIYAIKKIPNNIKTTGSLTNRSKTSTTKAKTGSDGAVTSGGKNEKPSSYLHLMAVVDLSSLLYPGVTKIRIATPLTTFHQKEALSGGLEKSYFRPHEPIPSPSTTKTVGKKSKDTIKSGKKSKGTSKSNKKSKSDSKSSKKSKSPKKGKKGKKEKVQQDDLNMKNALPPEPILKPPPEPSIKIYNEEGEPTFIVLEIELTQPLVEERKIDDLHNKLQELVHQKPQTPKVILNNKIAIEYCYNIVKEIIIDINRNYAVYAEASSHCYCEEKADFLTYLRRIGAYQKLISSIARVGPMLVQNKLNMIEENNDNQQPKNKFIEEIFINLATQVNQVLNKLTPTSYSIVKYPKNSMETLLFYAKEATEMNNFILAERYYLEVLSSDPNNPDYWFEYAIYKMECDEIEKAFMCLQEALSKNMYHRNSLLMNGILLAEKFQVKEAELCLLTVMVHEPLWVEGWAVLHLFYKEIGNLGGADLSEEMVQKYLDDPRTTDDGFSKIDDLAWTPSICPNTLFFRAAAILLKMRFFTWVENCLAYELKENGVVHYMLAVICYYKKKYEHALQHLERAKYFHGSDTSVVSLTGHCQMALGNLKEAYNEYTRILKSFELPKYNHLVHLNCAKITENIQEARKLFLVTCKHNPTPYTWMSCGIVYFKQNDLLSAEECFSEAVVLDNTSSDCWGYLTLINLKLKRFSEAEICCNLAFKTNLENEFLLEEIKKGFEKMISNTTNPAY